MTAGVTLFRRRRCVSITLSTTTDEMSAEDAREDTQGLRLSPSRLANDAPFMWDRKLATAAAWPDVCVLANWLVFACVSPPAVVGR